MIQFNSQLFQFFGGATEKFFDDNFIHLIYIKRLKNEKLKLKCFSVLNNAMHFSFDDSSNANHIPLNDSVEQN